jgi:cytochrome c oxidase subunit 2
VTRARRRGHRVGLAAAVAVLGLVLGACGGRNLPQDALDPKGSISRQLNDLIGPVFIVAALVFVLVEGLIIYAVIRFRRRSEDEAPVQVHGNARLELTWTIIPAAILAVIGVLTVATLIDLDRTPTGPKVVPVTVTGHQWWWEFAYPGRGVTTANELHIPTGRKIAVSLRSADVIHSFWPPKLAGKMDVIPNRRNHLVIEADKPGTYYGQCAEFCGLSHADMRLRVVAHTPAAFERWVAANATPAALPPPTDAQAAAGSLLFRQKGCASCHTVKGYSAGTVGPDLTHLQQRQVFAGGIFELNAKNLRTWIRNPPGEKPGSIMPKLELSEQEITQLIAYLGTLK